MNSIQIKKYNICIIVIGLFFGFSGMLFSIGQILLEYEKDVYVYCNAVFSFVIFCFIFQKSYLKVWMFLKAHRFVSALVIFLSIFYLFIVYVNGFSNGVYLWNFNLSLMLSWPGMVYFLFYLSNIITEIHKVIWECEDKKLIRFSYFIFSIIFLFVLIIYSLQSEWYEQYDSVYSMDCAWVWSGIAGKRGYFDIRHPLMGIMVFPLSNIVSFILNLFLPESISVLLRVVILQAVNIYLLISIAYMLRVLANSRYVWLMYILSFSSFIYFMVIEKYVLIVFFVVLYVFLRVKKSEYAQLAFVLAAGLLPLNVLLIVFELLFDDSPENRGKSILKSLVLGIVTIIISGRMFLFDYSFVDRALMKTTGSFASKLLTVGERFTATVNMYASIVISLPSGTNEDGMYMWNSIVSHIYPFGVIVLLVIILGFLRERKAGLFRIFFAWCLVSFILFVMLNWAPDESPLFAILFSWAALPLFVKGIDNILKFMKIEVYKKYIYGSISFLLFSFNLYSFTKIAMFFAN